MLGLGEVKRATVVLGIGGNDVDDESQHGGQVALEQEPAVGLSLDDARDAHGAGKTHDGHNRQAHREFITNHLRATAHGANKRVLAVTRPAGQQDAQHANRRHSNHEEHAYVEVDELQSLAPGQARKGEHAGEHHQQWRKEEQELVGVPQRDNLLGENLEHVGKNLQRAPGTHAQWTATTLYPAAQPTLIHDVEHGEQRIGQQQEQAHEHTLHCGGCPTGHQAA